MVSKTIPRILFAARVVVGKIEKFAKPNLRQQGINSPYAATDSLLHVYCLYLLNYVLCTRRTGVSTHDSLVSLSVLAIRPSVIAVSGAKQRHGIAKLATSLEASAVQERHAWKHG